MELVDLFDTEENSDCCANLNCSFGDEGAGCFSCCEEDPSPETVRNIYSAAKKGAAVYRGNQKRNLAPNHDQHQQNQYPRDGDIPGHTTQPRQMYRDDADNYHGDIPMHTTQPRQMYQDDADKYFGDIPAHTTQPRQMYRDDADNYWHHWNHPGVFLGPRKYTDFYRNHRGREYPMHPFAPQENIQKYAYREPLAEIHMPRQYAYHARNGYWQPYGYSPSFPGYLTRPLHRN